VTDYGTFLTTVELTQHQNPEFGPKLGEILKKPAKKYISLRAGGSNSEMHHFFVLN